MFIFGLWILWIYGLYECTVLVLIREAWFGRRGISKIHFILNPKCIQTIWSKHGCCMIWVCEQQPAMVWMQWCSFMPSFFDHWLGAFCAGRKATWPNMRKQTTQRHAQQLPQCDVGRCHLCDVHIQMVISHWSLWEWDLEVVDDHTSMWLQHWVDGDWQRVCGGNLHVKVNKKCKQEF